VILLGQQHGPLAQLVARLVRIEEVRSSNLLGSTTQYGRGTASDALVSDIHEQMT
jgi:hypothetical protein